jgi:hypothetical protein
LKSLTRSVAIFPEESTVEPPFEVHRISRFNPTRVICCKGNPLTIDQDFCSGDGEEKSLIPAFGQWNGLSCRNAGRNIGKKAVLFENSGRVD